MSRKPRKLEKSRKPGKPRKLGMSRKPRKSRKLGMSRMSGVIVQA